MGSYPQFTQSYPHFKLPLLLDFIRVCVSYPHYPHYYYYMCSAHFVHTSQLETQGTHSLNSLTTLLTFECFCVDTQTHFAIYGSILPPRSLCNMSKAKLYIEDIKEP